MMFSCIILIMILLIRQCILANRYPNEKNHSNLLHLVWELKIHYIIMTTNNKGYTKIGDSKVFSKHFIPVRLENHVGLEKYLLQETVPTVKTGLIFRENVQTVIHILNKLEEIGMLYKASRFTWVIFLDSCPTQESMKYNVPYNCQFIIVCPRNSTTFRLLETFNLKNTTFTIDFGIWNIDSGLTVPINFFYARRSNLNNTSLILRSAVMNNMCFEERACLLTEYLYYIASRLNFRYQLLPGWFSFQQIDPLQEADFYHNGVPSHADFQPDLRRMIVPFFTVHTDWYIKYPVVQSGDHLQPFHPYLWLAILVTIITGSSTIIIFWYKSKKYGLTAQKFNVVEGAFSAFDCFLSQEGSKNIPFKIPLGMLRFAAIFMIAAYSAEIISFLALRIPNIPFRNLNEFLENGDYVIAKSPGIYSESYLKTRTSPSIQLVNEKFSRVIKEEDLPDAICKEKVAMLLLDFNIQHFDKKCRLLKVEKPLDVMFFASLLPKNSPFTEVGNNLLLLFYSSGILQRHQTRIYAHIYEEYPPTPDEGLRPVELTQVIQLSLILLVGIIFSIIFLIFELVFQYFTFLISNKYKKRHSKAMLRTHRTRRFKVVEKYNK